MTAIASSHPTPILTTAVSSASPASVNVPQNFNPATASPPSSTFSNSPSSSVPVASTGGGLSAGAKAGIGVGAALGGILILGLLLLLFYRERRKGRNASSQQQQQQQPQPPSHSMSYSAPAQKLDSSTGATPATVVSEGSGGEVASSATWMTHEHKIPTATEYELTGDRPTPPQHDLEGGHGEAQSMVL